MILSSAHSSGRRWTFSGNATEVLANVSWTLDHTGMPRRCASAVALNRGVEHVRSRGAIPNLGLRATSSSVVFQIEKRSARYLPNVAESSKSRSFSAARTPDAPRP